MTAPSRLGDSLAHTGRGDGSGRGVRGGCQQAPLSSLTTLCEEPNREKASQMGRGPIPGDDCYLQSCTQVLQPQPSVQTHASLPTLPCPHLCSESADALNALPTLLVQSAPLSSWGWAITTFLKVSESF